MSVQSISQSETGEAVLCWRNTRSLAFLFLACITALGCERLGPPEVMRTGTVAGLVRVGGQPIMGGWIEFMPVDGAIGHLRTAPIGPDGRFSIAGVAVGTNAMRLTEPKTGRLNGRAVAIALRRFAEFTNPIRPTIREGENAPMDIDLYQEAAQFPHGGGPKG
jgi:hypothetical protein